MAKKLDLQEYGKALTLLKGMVEKMVPIKKTQFLADHTLSANFFRLLEEMGVITLLPDISNRKEGYRYDWHYRKADNETDSHLALRLTGRITEEARKAHVYYTTDAYKKKKAISDYKKDEKARNLKLKEEKEKARLLATATKREETKIEKGETETILLDKPDKKPSHAQASFQITGDLSREELIQKIELLILNTTISSFKVEVAYK